MEIMPWAATLDHHCAGARKGLLSSFFALLALACEPVKRHSARRCFLKEPAFGPPFILANPSASSLATCHLPPAARAGHVRNFPRAAASGWWSSRVLPYINMFRGPAGGADTRLLF